MSQAKKGLSPLAIVGIVAGVLLLLGIGTCAAGGYFAGQTLGEVKRNIADGGLVVVAPEAVKNALATDKKDYVGTWTSESEESFLTITANGELDYKKNETKTKTTLSGPIAELDGNDIVMKVGLEFRVKVKVPPHRVGDRLEMVADGITFHR
jgi:hypothetical protein